MLTSLPLVTLLSPLPNHRTELRLSEALGVRIEGLFALGLTEDPVQNPVLNAMTTLHPSGYTLIQTSVCSFKNNLVSVRF